ncbi:lipoprotein [Spiroplasma endosymbiont of Labia minor]|uniref:lipoprotein n=1 Tax=Spiroplasma endosymbiont of Labia minor TaxID=3066305 RepID=UPI0030D5FBB0
MKKMLTLLATITLTTPTTVSVVSCSSNTNFKDFEKWINQEQSFILYVGAKDCPHCQVFDKVFANRDLDQFEKNINTRIDANSNTIISQWYNTQQDYEELAESKTISDDYNSNYSQELKGNLLFHYFQSDNYSTIWSEKWASNLVDWLVDGMIARQKIIDDFRYGDNDSFYDSLDFKSAIESTPLFVIIRNGKLAGVTNGMEDESTTGNNDDQLIDDWFTTISNMFVHDDWNPREDNKKSTS